MDNKKLIEQLDVEIKAKKKFKAALEYKTFDIDARIPGVDISTNMNIIFMYDGQIAGLKLAKNIIKKEMKYVHTR